jgi:hypothetical protein
LRLFFVDGRGPVHKVCPQLVLTEKSSVTALPITHEKNSRYPR